MVCSNFFAIYMARCSFSYSLISALYLNSDWSQYRLPFSLQFQTKDLSGLKYFHVESVFIFNTNRYFWCSFLSRTLVILFLQTRKYLGACIISKVLTKFLNLLVYMNFLIIYYFILRSKWSKFNS